MRKFRTNLREILLNQRAEQHLLMEKYQTRLTAYYAIPELVKCFDFQQENKWHNLPLWEHTAKTVGGCKMDFITRTAALFHDFAKPDCAVRGKDGYLHYKGHGAMSAEQAGPILLRIGVYPNEVDAICELIQNHDQFLEENEAVIKELHEKLGHTQFMRLLDLRQADINAQGDLEKESRLAKVERIKNSVLALETEEDREMAIRSAKKHACPVCYPSKCEDVRPGEPGNVRIRYGYIETFDSAKGWVVGDRVSFCPKCGRNIQRSGRSPEFQMGPYDCKLEPTKDGMTLFVNKVGKGKVPALHLKVGEDRRKDGRIEADLTVAIVDRSADPKNIRAEEELVTPDNAVRD